MMKYTGKTFALAFAMASTPCWSQDEPPVWKVSLFAADAPSATPWKDPAQISVTLNDDAKDSYAYQFSLGASKYLGSIGKSGGNSLFFSPKINWQRNNQQSAPQNKFVANLGLHWEATAGIDIFASDKNIYSHSDTLWTHDVDMSFGYSRNSVFADLTKNGCDEDASPAFCRTQHEEALEGALTYSPFNPKWNSETKSGNWAYSFIPSIGFFWNDLLNQPIDPETLAQLDGSVYGLVANVSGAISPELYNYRWRLGVIAQTRQRFHSSQSRAAGFTKNAELLKISLDYRLYESGPKAEESGFLPSIGLTYTTGEDPLVGLKKQENLMLALKIAFK